MSSEKDDLNQHISQTLTGLRLSFLPSFSRRHRVSRSFPGKGVVAAHV